MAQGARPARVGEEIRQELAQIIARDVHDPGVGFLTLTRTKVSPDLQLVRVYYTTIGDEKARRATQQALERATPFLRRQIGARIRLRRVPEIRFEFDRSVEHQDRIEQILIDIAEERRRHPIDDTTDEAAAGSTDAADADDTAETPDDADGTPGADR
ncbi:MAG: ribosome-binding factor A [Acidobacteria bacterium SCN 69-37]|nr:MAG: ribosome-binding factor A [Acidobacteria bacterium SCN 69-37]